jgi:hypothetical protein
VRTVALLAAAVALTACTTTQAAAGPAPRQATAADAAMAGAATGVAGTTRPTGINQFDATACKHYQAGLVDLQQEVADGEQHTFAPMLLQVEVQASHEKVAAAADVAEGTVRAAMEQTAAALRTLNAAINDTWTTGLDIDQELLTVGTAINAVRPLCAANGVDVTVNIS